jgi:hypothetical protein
VQAGAPQSAAGTARPLPRILLRTPDHLPSARASAAVWIRRPYDTP